MSFIDIENNKELFHEVLHSTVVRFWGEIKQSIRAIGIGYYDKVIIHRVIFDGPFSEKEKDDVRCVHTEIICDFGTSIKQFDLQFLSVPYPENLGEYKTNWGWFYLRKEPVDFIRVPKEND